MRRLNLSLNLNSMGSGARALAAIIYDGTLLNIASERFLKDVGASPRDNATLYSGRAKQFATDMSMPITVAAGQHLYKFDYDTDTFVHYEIPGGMTTYHLGKVDGSGAFENKTYGLVVVFTNELSTADFNLMTSEPEALVNMVANDVADARFTVTKSDCSVCMTLTEDGKYSRNYAVDLGDTITSDSDSYTPVNSATFIDGVAHITVANDWLYFDTGYIGSATTAVFEYEILETNDKILELCDSQPTTNRLLRADTVIDSSLGIHREIVTININGIARLGIGRYSNDGNSFIGKIANFSLVEATASEINNYNTLPNPDIRALNTGLPTTPFKLDSLGMIDGVGDGMEWHGEEYASTNIILSPIDDWSIELIQYIDDNGYQEIFGNSVNGARFRKFDNALVYFYIGGTTIDATSSTVDAKNHYIVSYNSTTQKIILFIDGVPAATEGVSITDFSVLLLGKDNSSSDYMRSASRIFKGHKKQMSQEDVTKAYNDAIAKGYL